MRSEDPKDGFSRLAWMALAMLSVQGCWMEENTVWNNSLDPANPRFTPMVRLAGGTFRMGGDTTATTDGSFCGATEHAVSLSGFLLDSTEVTIEDWKSLMPFSPSRREDCPRCPVENLTWFEAIVYCNARSKSQGLDTAYEWVSMKLDSTRVVDLVSLRWIRSRNGYRLPTEAEWEYAARGGSSDGWFWGNDSLLTPNYAQVGRGGFPITQKVGELAPTGAGLYDMQGNVWEWTFDWWEAFDAKPRTDPAGPEKGTMRVIRGGSIVGSIGAVKNGDRGVMLPQDANTFVGFRCARSLVP